MTQPQVPAPATFPVADLERRFLAFAVDRAISWGLYAAAGVGGWLLWGRDGLLVTGGVVAGLAVLMVLVTGILTGTSGATPGKRVAGLRVVHHGTGTTIGAGAGILRALVVGLSALPTFGFGLAALAWTAVADPRGQRRGWHDQLTHSVVVDLRPPVASTVEEGEITRHVVNLTALRLVPAPAQPAPVVERPARPVQPPQQALPQQPAAPQPPVRQAAPQTAPQPLPQAAPWPPQPPAPHQPPPGQPWPQQPAPQQPAPQQPAPRHRAPQPPSPQHQQPAGQPWPQQPGAGQPHPQQPPPQQPAARQPVPAQAPDSGRTVARGGPAASPATGPTWRVVFDTGEAFVVEGLALVGRRPEPRSGEQVRHVVPLPSSDMSLSKTHAQFGPAPDGSLVVMDRGSTNGSVLLRQGVSRDLTAGKPATLVAGDRVRFGDREMSVERAG